MPRVDFVDILLDDLRMFEKYRKNLVGYAKMIKGVVRRRDPEGRVLIFGSTVKGEARPDSDIDVLVVTELAGDLDERLRLRMEIARAIGDVTPFEIHIVTREEFEGWYMRFIDEYVEV